MMNNKAIRSQQFLQEHVSPLIQPILAKIVNERPDDVLAFLANAFQEQVDLRQTSARIPAKEAWEDPRLDPRQVPVLKYMALSGKSSDFLGIPQEAPDNEYAPWEELMKKANSPEALQRLAVSEKKRLTEGNMKLVPKDGIDISTGHYISSPDNNTIPLEKAAEEISP